ncbi:MAG TPA: efflux transporter outer membrane subunit [Steroidobacteraceae bacterium]|jgi:NodT family efflux transporter outer membrane factor (OMF) lipoprotein|nr:efflux transporter outer membrane subunit [Steroidobacteraceae bacterium]
MRGKAGSMLKTLVLLGAVSLAGCVLPPKESPHPRELASEEVGLTGAAAEPAADGWWESFNDQQLDRLIRLGLKDSPTLAQAQTRVSAALAQTESARAALRPNANFDASALYQRAPNDYLIPPPLAGHTFWMGQAGATLGWDLDFFGRQAQAVHRAQDLAQSARLDVEDARLMLASAITQAYIELYRENALADIAHRSELQRQNIVDITRRRVAAGLDTQLEIREAEGELPQARVARTQAQAAAQLAVHELATLSGQGAESYPSIVRPALKVDAALPVPSDLPINLLARRPDVLSARSQVAAADAQRLASKAAFYPDVNLKGLAGIGAFGMSNLVQWSARGFGAGPFISLPLFDGGRLRAEYRGSEAQLDSAIDGYNDTVLHAVEQTADQITRIDALARERIDQQQTLDATEAAYKLAEERYRAGLASYLSVLNAETQVLAARQTMVDIVASQAVARVTLLVAVGGSFDPRPTGTVAGRHHPDISSQDLLTRAKP